jgi:hypothetical protein
MHKPGKFFFEKIDGRIYAVSTENELLREEVDDALYQYLKQGGINEFKPNKQVRKELALAMFGDDSLDFQKKAGFQIEYWTWGLKLFKHQFSLFVGDFINGERHWKFVGENTDPVKTTPKKTRRI